MLVLTRQEDECIVIGRNIVVTVLQCAGQGRAPGYYCSARSVDFSTGSIRAIDERKGAYVGE